MKFILVIWVCSFLGGKTTCMPPIQFPILYNSWYECSRAVHTESIRMLSKMGYKYVNDNRIGFSYSCKSIPTI
jgi:hypothetical protein